ncbi:lipopolysaccharide biosynthesis protein [Enterococcus sp.]|uniref:lipopolysaccharide biosynthesis protein n=1 Tax=Enterococcus sp. TaxID=35783 RepID=UPI0005E5F2E2|nr:hypothetical protein [Enterococcus sp.]COJ58636.1 polysaccharide transporter [Streptococcus pneumoniae]
MNIKQLLKDFGFVIFSNLQTLSISTIIVLVVPKIIGVKEYGYWQLFMFYSSYLGILHIGWLDGIYLRYGGEMYEDLNKKLFHNQFWLLMTFQTVFALIIIMIATFSNDKQYSFILYALSLYLLINISQSFCKFILQITNRIREYSVVTVLTNTIYIATVIILMLSNVRDFRMLIMAFIFGNMVASFYALFLLKDIIFQRDIHRYFESFNEALSNIKAGFPLLMANLSAMLVIGVVRIGIQKGWGVEEFGKVSLTLSISNLLMIFINSVSLIIFPKLKRINYSKVKKIYPAIRDLLMPAIFVSMLVYFPINYLIPMWLPQYDSALVYMSVLFPMVAYQAKFEILSNTFMKVIRMEKQLLILNVFAMVISTVLTGVCVLMLHNLTLTVFSIVIVMAIRSTIAEWYIRNKLNVRLFSEICLEMIIIASFVLLSWYLNNIQSAIGYILILIIYIRIKHSDISKSIKLIKEI